MGVLQEALKSASDSGDPAVVLRQAAADAAENLTAAAGLDSDPGPEPSLKLAICYVLGWYHWFRYQALPEGGDQEALAAALVMFMPLARTQPDLMPGVLGGILHNPDPAEAAELVALGTAVLAQARATPGAAAARTAAELLELALSALPDCADEAVTALGNLAAAQLTLYERTGDPRSLDRAVEYGRRAAAIPGPRQGVQMGTLTMVLLTRHGRTGSDEDLEESIRAGRAALHGTAPEHLPTALIQLGGALRARFAWQGRREDLDEALMLGRRAVELAGDQHPQPEALLSHLGNCLLDMFDLTDSAEMLDEAIAVKQAALDSVVPGNPVRCVLMTNLGNALRNRASRFGDRASAERAVDLGRQALRLVAGWSPQRPVIISGLATSLRVAFELSGSAVVLREAIELCREALAGSEDGDPNLLGRISNLATSLWASYELTGNVGGLEEATEVLRDPRAESALAEADPADLPGFLNNLATVLLAGHERSGDLTLLDESIQRGREAVAAAAGPVQRAMCLSLLANALLTRFEVSAVGAYLREAVEAIERAAAEIPADHADRPRFLSNLGNTLRVHYERTGQRSTLDRAVEVLGQAVEDTHGDQPERVSYLINFAAALHTRYEAGHDVGDLERAIDLSTCAVRDAVPEGPDHGPALSNLGAALMALFERRDTSQDERELLERVVDTTAAAADRFSATHPHRAVALGHLGTALRARSRLTGRKEDLRAAEDAFRRAARLREAPVSVQFAAARHWASTAGDAERWHVAMDGYRHAFALLPQLTTRRLARTDQEFQLGEAAGLASDAAACALQLHDPALALRLLEQGRGVLMGQLLDTRSDLSALRADVPELATRLEEIGLALDAPVRPPSSASRPHSGPAPSAEIEDVRTSQRRADLYQAWRETLSQIRTHTRWKDFLMPPSLPELQDEAAAGPIVALNISDIRSDAILLTAEGVKAVPLPGAAPATVRNQVAELLESVTAAHDPELPLARSAAAQDHMHSVLGWLWDAIAEPVLKALGLDADVAADEGPWPRLWWMPAGALAFLPLHAAGHHLPDRRRAPGQSVLDHVTSSYTPTIRSLSYLRRHRSPARRARLLAVGLEKVAGAPELTGAADEAARVARLFSKPTALPGSGATRARVLSLLPEYTWVHFACHGWSDPVSPSSSRLLLHDYLVQPLTVTDIEQLRLAGAQLAFLSACSTAQTNAAIPDESLHMAGAFQLAGFPQVVATLWPLSDQLAGDFAEDFYMQLRPLDASGLDTVPSAAEALHTVTRRYRAWYLDAPTLWACHIYAGA